MYYIPIRILWRCEKGVIMSAIIRKHINFYGHVQGVGFRYRAKYAANGIGVTGWVRNEYDGSVEMEIQGTEEQIHQVLKMINQGTYIDIQRMDTKVIETEVHENGFHVR